MDRIYPDREGVGNPGPLRAEEVQRILSALDGEEPSDEKQPPGISNELALSIHDLPSYMSRRDRFIAAAACGRAAAGVGDVQAVAEYAVHLADALEIERKKAKGDRT